MTFVGSRHFSLCGAIPHKNIKIPFYDYIDRKMNINQGFITVDSDSGPAV